MRIAELIISIANNVKGIKDNVLAAYDTVANKGGEVPEEKTIANLPAAIASTHDTLEELTITANGEYTPQDGVDGFSKVVANVIPSMLVKPNHLTVTNNCIVDGYWAGELLDTSMIKSMTNMFSNCSSLQQLDVSKWDVSSVTSIYCTFYNCSLLQQLDVSNWDVSSVDNMSSAFRECSSLQQLDVSNWDVSSVTTTILMFSNCSSLQQLDVSKWDVSSVTSTINMFAKCSSLQSIIGNRTIDDVLANNIGALSGLKVALSLNTTILDRASLRAVINGLADLTGQTAQTLTLGATLMAKLTEEDIAIAVGKNWSIA